MGNRKGQKQYPESIKEQIKKEYNEGASMMLFFVSIALGSIHFLNALLFLITFLG